VRLRLQAALVNKRLGREAHMRADLLQALRQGQRLGLVRSLLDVDPAAIDLISETTLEKEPDPLLSFYVDRLRAAARSGSETTTVQPAASASMASAALSDRESEIMRLLGQAMPNKKIARTLGLSPETVKWHLKNIYGKLGVASRDEAVARMRDINVVSRH
jgi:LuxR family maltose regulon positive regulatory protein